MDLFDAIGRNKVDVIEDIIALDSSEIHKTSTYGHTPLSLAIECNSVALTKLLLTNGADVNKKVNITSPVSARISSGFVPLMFVKSVEMVELLCNYNVDVKATNDEGRSVLFIVGQSYNVDVLKSLEEYGAVISLDEINLLREAAQEELEFRSCELAGSEQEPRIIVLKNMVDWCDR